MSALQPLTNPKLQAFKLANKLRKFRAQTEIEAANNKDHERSEVVRVIDWYAYNELINQLELCFKVK